MRSLHLMLTIVAAGLLTGCASTAAPPEVSAAGPAGLYAADIPAEARAAYLSGLTQIDPSLTSDEDRAVRRATYICRDMAEGKDEVTVINNTRQRFSGGDETLDDAKVAEVVGLARVHVCKL